MTKREAGASRGYLGVAHAQTNETGATVTYRNSTEPNLWEGFDREYRALFADRNPARAVGLEGNRERERVELERNRERVGATDTNRAVVPVRYSVRDSRGRRISDTPTEPADSETNLTYRITIGNGFVGERTVPIETLARVISGAIGRFGFAISEGLGAWDGQLEHSATVTFQGPEAIAHLIMEAITDTLPLEEMAHVEITEPVTLYEPLPAYGRVRT